MEMTALRGRVALITGGSKGIGKATALLMAQRGANVALLARSNEDLQAATQEIIIHTGQPCIALVADVCNLNEMRTQFARLTDQFGRLDILVNCAGTNNPKGTLDTSLDEWLEVINTNLTGTFISCKLAAEIMSRQMAGSIVNVSSVQSRMGGRSPQYSASKAGVEGLTKSLAREMAQYNVRVNAIAPGGTETEFAKKYWPPATRERLRQQTLLGRIAEPEEIAKAIVFIASDEASYITGATLHVNGGFYLN